MRNGNPDTKIITHLSYEQLFNEIRKGQLILPISYIKDLQNLDSYIDEIIKDFDSTESIRYSSFLNMIIQTYGINESLKLGLNELNSCGLSNKNINAIVFHQENLLYYICKIILKKENGHLNITGNNRKNNTKEYYKTLLLINSELNKIKGNNELSFLKNIFIRSYPYYYSPRSAFHVYSTRIQRYWYIYDTLLKKSDKNKIDKIEATIKLIENKTKISLQDYFYVLRQMLMWFLEIPIKKQLAKDRGLDSVGFNYKNLNTFYINKINFKTDPRFINLIENLSLDLKEFKGKFSQSNQRYKVKGFYEHFQNFFDYPVFKINNNDFCIIDLKFLIEGICSGFLWHIKNISPNQFKEIKPQYGYILEKYFVFLVKNIFPNIKITSNISGKPDAILEYGNSVVIFEFTTEYYRFSSLYNAEISQFLDDLYKMLFNNGKKDKKGRGKKDEGKFIKLNRYIEEFKGKKVIPVLITENYLGDYDLLDKFGNFLKNEVKNKNLKNIQEFKPLVISLDDLETFWALSNNKNSCNEFIEAFNNWENVKKGSYHYNLSYFIARQKNGKVQNNNYKKFFNFKKFLD